MNRERNQFTLWLTIAGVLFMMVGTYDLFFLTHIAKSGFVIALEIVAGICFLLNALLHWRKSRGTDVV